MTQLIYTVDQAAEVLHLHAKTVRRFIHEGRLKAKRIGKEYRIMRADLAELAGTEHSLDHPPVARTRHVVASTIIDADVVSPELSDRITTMLMSAMNSRKGEG